MPLPGIEAARPRKFGTPCSVSGGLLRGAVECFCRRFVSQRVRNAVAAGFGLAVACQGELAAAQSPPFAAPPALEQRLVQAEQRLHELELQRLPGVEDARMQQWEQRLLEAEQRIEQLATPRPQGVRGSFIVNQDNGEGDRGLLERVEALEEQIDEQASELQTYVGKGTDAATLEIEGRIHLDYWAFPESSTAANALETGELDEDPQDRFGFRRIRLGFEGLLYDYVVYALQIEFSEPNEVEFRDVYLGFEELGFFNTVQIGNQKRPYGLDHLNSSNVNVFLERPFAVEAFNEDARRLGICSYNVSDDLRYNWRYGVYNMRNIQDEGVYISDNYQLEVAGRLASTVWYDESSDGRGYAHLAVSGTTAFPDGSNPSDNVNIGPDAGEARFRTRPEARSTNRWLDTGFIAGAEHYHLLGLESVVNLGPLQFAGEYLNTWMEREAGFGDDLHFHGGYFYVSYFLTGEHQEWDRRTGTLDQVEPFENFWLVDTCRDGVQSGIGAWRIAARLSHGDFSDGDIFGGVGDNVTFGVNWWWNANARMQLNYIYGEVDDAETDVGGTPTLVSGTYSIAGARWMIYF